jgi:hypothetical protein
VLLSDGAVRLRAPASEFASHPAFVGQYLG